MSSSPSPSPPDTVVKNRFLGFLIWQSIPSTLVFLLFKTLISTLTTPSSATTTTTNSSSATATLLIASLTFVSFHLSQLLFSAALSAASSPHPDRPAPPVQLALGLFRFVLVGGGGGEGESLPNFRRRARVALSFVLFVTAAAVAGLLSSVSVCWVKSGVDFDFGSVGFRGFAIGLLYGCFYVYKQRWVLEFPIIQRPPFFRFKMALPLAVTQALKLSVAGYLFSAALILLLPYQLKMQDSFRKLIFDQIIFLLGSFAVFLCWEISHHVHQVLHTKRFIFAPPKGSAAAETNPSEPLIAALEESAASSLLRYLAYLDLCMVCENNVDTWRRAALFEETGETYKRVVAICLRPLEQLASKFGEGLEGSFDKTNQLSHQLQSPSDLRPESKFYEELDNFQLCAWSARIVASLTTRSLKEDRFGVAQLSGSNAAAVSTLLSCLLAVETFMGKKTRVQSPQHLMGPAGIKWATLSSARRDVPIGVMAKKSSGPLHSKAYAMADVLRTSIYCIISTFHDQMLTSVKGGLLEKDWVVSSKPLFGSRELLMQKLRLFLDFQA